MSSSSTVDIITCVVPGLVVCQCLYDVVSLYKLCQLELSMSFNGWFTESLNSCTKNNYRHTFPKVENRLTLDRIISSLNVLFGNMHTDSNAYINIEPSYIMYTWAPTVYMLSWCCLIIKIVFYQNTYKRCHLTWKHLMMKWYDQGWVYFLLLGKCVYNYFWYRNLKIL